MIKLKFEGFKELERALAEELPKATAKTVLRRTAINALEPVRAGMAERAPKDTGDLAGRMKTKAVKAKRISRTRYAKSNGVSYNTGPTGHPEGGNAAWQEFGTVNQPAQPYARPTAAAESPAVIESVKAELTKQVEKAKLRIAKRAKKRK